MGQVPASGDIGIRCSRSRTNLWFHLPFIISEDSQLNSVGSEEVDQHTPAHAEVWMKLTDQGRRFVGNVTRLPGVERVVLRRSYIDVSIGGQAEADAEATWRRLAPQIVTLVCQEGYGGVVYHYPSYDLQVTQWHVPLLERMSH